MRGRGFLVVALAAATLVLGASASATSTLPGRNGAVAVVARPGDGDAGRRLAVVPLERGAGGAYWLTQTDSLSWLEPPLPSPDGQTVAYASVGQHVLLRLMRIDGSRQQFLVEGFPVAWAPDSTALVIAPPAGGLTLVDLAAGAVRAISDVGRGGAWAPDGATLAFTSDSGLQLWPRSGGPTRSLGRMAGSLAWSPDGSTIAVADDWGIEYGKGLHLIDVATGARRALWYRVPRELTWAPDGSGLGVLADDGTLHVLFLDGRERVLDGTFDRLLGWRADGRLVTLRDQAIVIVPAPGSRGSVRTVRPAPSGYSLGDAALLPGGRRAVALVEPQGVDSEIVLYDPASRRRQQLTNDRLEQSDPVWAPDGERLAYVQRPAGATRRPATEVIVADPSTGHRRLLVVIPAVDALAWSADGRWLGVLTEGSLRAYSLLDGRPRMLRERVQSIAAFAGQAAAFLVTYSGRQGLRHAVVPVRGPALAWRFADTQPWYIASRLLSPDGRRLASISVEQNACGSYCDEPRVFLSGPHGTRRATIPGIAAFGQVLDVAWSPDSTRLALATGGSTVPIVHPDGSSTELDLGVPGIVEVAWAPRPR